MAEQLYKDSVYRFTDPVRYFKANDPYFFEVDNIPLKQLQENCLWLKDQLAKEVDQYLNVKRGNIDELKPYANGADRVVRVKPGRFTARMNDVVNKQPLQFMAQALGAELGDVNVWGFATNNQGQWPMNASPSYNYLLRNALDKFKSTLAQDALGMAGLAERAFTFPVVNAETPVSHGTYGDFTWGALVTTQVPFGQQGYPHSGNTPPEVGGNPATLSEYSLWAKIFGGAINHFNIETYGGTGVGAVEQVLLESQFIKKWRGVSRLAIVDVPEELTITVPPFSPDDFNYINENGQETSVDGVQNRIDMVFIYSKSVDTSAVTINKGTTTTTITTPALGLVRGAGIKMTWYGGVSPEDALNPDKWSTLDDQGNLKILAAPGDQANDNLGFTAASGNDIAYDVRGSFPSPDDILNIAPLLSEKLEDTAFELIGQSILPVAYVWVKTGGSESADGAAIVLSTDVIDIRPLFRTAELTYNERAGLAAAIPQLSLANPVASKNQVDYEIKRLFDYTENRIDNLTDDNFFDPTLNMCTLATGYVFGGWKFGPEGALYDYQRQETNNTDSWPNEDLRNLVRTTYGYEAGTVPSMPDWNIAKWVAANSLSNQGSYPNDYITTYLSQFTGSEGPADIAMPFTSDATIVAGSFYGNSTDDGTQIRRWGSSNANKPSPTGGNGDIADVTFHYVSKRIEFNRSQAPWLVDYTVDIEFINCINQTGMGQFITGEAYGHRDYPANTTGWWIEKELTAFTIYVAMVTTNPNGRWYQSGSQSIARFPAPHYRSSTSTTKLSDRGDVNSRFSGFMVPVGDILYGGGDTPVVSIQNGYESGYIGNPRMGKCSLPTIMWKLTGIPSNDVAHHYTNLNGQTANPVVILRGT